MTKWIKCSDRMPADGVSVWVYLTDGTVERDTFNKVDKGMAVTEDGTGKFWFNSNGWYNNSNDAWTYPTQWMEIEPPEPPKEDE